MSKVEKKGSVPSTPIMAVRGLQIPFLLFSLLEKMTAVRIIRSKAHLF